MTTFLMGTLAVLIVVFLVMLAVQMIRIEKTLIDIVDTATARVSKMYNAPEE